MYNDDVQWRTNRDRPAVVAVHASTVEASWSEAVVAPRLVREIAAVVVAEVYWLYGWRKDATKRRRMGQTHEESAACLDTPRRERGRDTIIVVRVLVLVVVLVPVAVRKSGRFCRLVALCTAT
jgi:hypothetical protein